MFCHSIRGRVKKQGLIIDFRHFEVSAAQMALGIDFCTLVGVLISHFLIHQVIDRYFSTFGF